MGHSEARTDHAMKIQNRPQAKMIGLSIFIAGVVSLITGAPPFLNDRSSLTLKNRFGCEDSAYGAAAKPARSADSGEASCGNETCAAAPFTLARSRLRRALRASSIER